MRLVYITYVVREATQTETEDTMAHTDLVGIWHHSTRGTVYITESARNGGLLICHEHRAEHRWMVDADELRSYFDHFGFERVF